jgi:tetratricopeptide (TPR) repeat protein
MKGSKISCFFLLIALSFFQLPAVHCQVARIDSLLTLLKEDKSDTSKLAHLYALSDEYEVTGEYDKGVYYGKQAIALADEILNNTGDSEKEIVLSAKKYKAKAYMNIGIIYGDQGSNEEALKNYFISLKLFTDINDRKGIGSCYNNIGNAYNNMSNNPEALKNYFASLKIREAIGDKKGVAGAYNNIGLIHFNQGNYPEAIKNYFACLKIMETISNKAGVATSLNNIGLVYTKQGNYQEALKNFTEALKIRKALDLKKGIASTYSNIGLIYEYQLKYPEALENYLASLKMREALRDAEGIASSFNNIGTVYFNQGNNPFTARVERDRLFGQALKNYFASLEIKNRIGDRSGISSSFKNIGEVYAAQKKYQEAGEYFARAEELAKETGFTEVLKATYQALSLLDSARGDFKGAYENRKLYILYRDSLDNEQTRKKTVESQMTYDFEKKEAIAAAEHKKELENQHVLAEEKSRKQKVIIIFVVFGLLLVLTFAAFIFRSLRTTRKQKNVIEHQKELVEKQKFEVEAQKTLVEEHQKEIIDSIRYAKRIQNSQLPTEKYIGMTLKRLNRQ